MKKLTTLSIISALIFSFLAVSFWQPEPVAAHSCAFPDFAVLDYDLNSSENSLHTYTYDPTTLTTATYSTEIFGIGSGHAFIHGFAYGMDGQIYLSRFDGSDYIQSYTGDPFDADFGREGTTYSDSEMVSLGEGVAIDKEAGLLYVLSSFQSAIFMVDTNTPGSAPVQIADAPQSSSQYSQFGIEVGPDSRVYVMTIDDTIEVYDPALPMGTNYGGVFATGTGIGDYGSRDIAFGPDGNIYTTGVNDAATGTHTIRRYQGPYGAAPGSFMDAMLIEDSNGEWPHGLTFHPTTGEIFVANFSLSGGIHVYSYTVGVATPTHVIEHVNPGNPDGLAKDIQFLECTDMAPTAISLGSFSANDGFAGVFPILAGLLMVGLTGVSASVLLRGLGTRRTTIGVVRQPAPVIGQKVVVGHSTKRAYIRRPDERLTGLKRRSG